LRNSGENEAKKVAEWCCVMDRYLFGGFLAYYRVSTGSRANQALALQAVATYLNGGNWRIVGEFVEVESGRRSDRPKLDETLAAARVLPDAVAR
jgi:hypothetical protein